MTKQTDFTRIIRPGDVRVSGREHRISIFCKVEFKGGRLSITGVEGPLSNGNCIGGCGQINGTLAEAPADAWIFAEGWDAAKLAEFLAAWDRWHLNDMRAYDAEMAAAGWPEMARRPILKYEFSLTTEAFNAKRTVEGLAVDAVREGKPFYPLPEQTRAVAMPYSLTIYAYPEDGEPAAPDGYKRKAPLHDLLKGVQTPERKTLGWVRPDEHPDGLLTRKLREDGPGYGTAWFGEDVPADVLAFLRGLPVADRKPAWV